VGEWWLAQVSELQARDQLETTRIGGPADTTGATADTGRTIGRSNGRGARERAALPAWGYLAGRGLRPYTSLVYGLGYGLPVPAVHRNVIEAASQSLMLRRDGTWLWAGSVVYADPPMRRLS